MTNQFQAGNVVELKSGGPKMTVDEVRMWNGVLEASCSWFEGNKKHTDSFPVTSLKQAAVA